MKMAEVKKDIEEMNKAFGDPNADVKTDPPATNAPNDEGNKTDAPTTDAPNDGDENKTDPPKTAPPATDPPDEKDKTINELRIKLADTEEKLKKGAPKTKPPTTDSPVESQDFLKDVDIEDVTGDKVELNKLLNTVYQKALLDARKGVKAPVDLVNLPETIATINTLHKASEEFYNGNKDLEPFKKVVSLVFNDLVEKNKDKPITDILKDVASETRKRLNLPPQKQQAKTNTNQRPPNLPRKKGSARGSGNEQEPDKRKSQISEMNQTLGR